MRRVFLVLASCTLLLLALPVQSPASSQDASPVPTAVSTTLTFVVRGLRNDVGTVAGGVYTDPARWPQPRGEVSVCRSPIRNRVSRCVLHVPGGGRYAFAFVHDEDGNGRIAQDIFGIPQEGYGFANDARSGLSAPSFESAAVQVVTGAHFEQSITTRYGISL